jgi:hypothetical protein
MAMALPVKIAHPLISLMATTIHRRRAQSIINAFKIVPLGGKTLTVKPVAHACDAQLASILLAVS